VLALAELQDSLVRDHAVEAKRPEVAQVGSVAPVASLARVEQRRRHPGQQCLAAMADRGKTGRDDHGGTEVALRSLLGLPGV
jgi:hypothetical protein